MTNTYYPRTARQRLVESLAAYPVVVLTGADSPLRWGRK